MPDDDLLGVWYRHKGSGGKNPGVLGEKITVKEVRSTIVVYAKKNHLGEYKTFHMSRGGLAKRFKREEYNG